MNKELLDKLKIIYIDSQKYFGEITISENQSTIVGVIWKNNDSIYEWFKSNNLNEFTEITVTGQQTMQIKSLNQTQKNRWLKCYHEMEYVDEHYVGWAKNKLFGEIE